MSEDKKFQEFYSKEAEVYEQRRYETPYGLLFRRLHHALLSKELAKVPVSAKCLEVACGTGHTTRLLAQYFDTVTACDLTPAMMSKNQKSENVSNVEYLQANAFELPFPDNSVEVLVSTRFLHLFPWHDQARLFEEFHRVLVPGGRLLIDFDNIVPRWLYVLPHFIYNLLRYKRAAPFSIYNFSGATMKAIANTGFENLNSQGVGGWHLAFINKISTALSYRLGLKHRNLPLRLIAEQFLISGTKKISS
tara:strand:- start:1222 stop:1968 length:747 start_codon:yes stop_codon:yes gene_type:complete